MKIGLFGGSFDPIHLGHLTLAEAAHRELSLDQVHFIPCRQSPHKSQSTGASALQRCAMIDRAITGLSWAGVNRLELERSTPSYSWQTVAWYRATCPGADLFWILGSDQWDTIETWANSTFLARSLTFVAFPRGSDPQPKPGYRMVPLSTRHPARSTRVRENAALDSVAPEVARYIRQQGLYEAG